MSEPVTSWPFATWGRIEVDADDEVQIAIRTGPRFQTPEDGFVRTEVPDVAKMKELLDAAQDYAKKRKEL
jgi:hypothetical protein